MLDGCQWRHYNVHYCETWLSYEACAVSFLCKKIKWLLERNVCLGGARKLKKQRPGRAGCFIHTVADEDWEEFIAAVCYANE
jgi:hypothetical protein